MADLDAIMDSRPQGTEPASEQQQARDDGRDERGRFAPGQAREQAQQDQQPPDPRQEQPEQQPPDPNKPPPGFIPQQAFDARLAKAEEKFNERYSALENQLRTFQLQHRPPQAEPKPPPDFFENPDAAFEARLQKAISPIAQSQSQIVENFSRMMAAEKFGTEAVEQAMGDLTSRVNANPQGMRSTYDRIMSNPHPYGELVRWHKEQAALKTYGDDPEAWRTAERERIRAELLAEGPGGQNQQQQPPQRPQSMPTSFASARNNGPRSAVAFSGPKPLSEIMGGR